MHIFKLSPNLIYVLQSYYINLTDNFILYI